MGNNASVRNFRANMQNLYAQMRQSMHETLLLQAQELCGDIRSAIEHSESGHLKESVRYQDVSVQNTEWPKLTVLVRAGGPLTTRTTEQGHSFDYALAEEFGTSKEEPRPFFYGTVRFYRAGGNEAFRETFEQTIAENNRVRSARAAGPEFDDGDLVVDRTTKSVQRGGTLTRTIIT